MTIDSDRNAEWTATRLYSRAVIRLSPLDSTEDVTDFVESVVTSDIRHLPAWTGLLSSKGKALFDFIVWPAGECLLLDCEADAAEDLVKLLTYRRHRRRIGVALDEGVAVHWRSHEGDGATSDPRLHALGQRWIAPADPSIHSADDRWLAHRLSLGVAEGRSELGSDMTPWLECNAVELNGIDFEKDTYIGYDAVAHAHSHSGARHRLLIVPLGGADPETLRFGYPQLGLGVALMRNDQITPQLKPKWLKS